MDTTNRSAIVLNADRGAAPRRRERGRGRRRGPPRSVMRTARPCARARRPHLRRDPRVAVSHDGGFPMRRSGCTHTRACAKTVAHPGSRSAGAALRATDGPTASLALRRAYWRIFHALARLGVMADLAVTAAVVGGVAGVVTGAIGSLAAPWANWAVEKRRTDRAEKRAAVEAWRSGIAARKSKWRAAKGPTLRCRSPTTTGTSRCGATCRTRSAESLNSNGEA